MSDENKKTGPDQAPQTQGTPEGEVSVGAILWEYADYTPPPRPKPEADLPLAQAQMPPLQAPAQTGMASPQPKQAPAPQPAPVQPSRPASQPAQAGPLPANQAPPKAEEPAPAPSDGQPAPEQAAPPPAEQAPKEAAGQPEPQTPQPEAPQTAPQGQSGQADPQTTGVAQDDGPDLIGFTPDPKAAKKEGGQAPQDQGGMGGQPPPSAAGQGAKPSFREKLGSPFAGRKAPQEEAAPPDAPPGQLAEEYGLGLAGRKTRTTAAAILSGLLLLIALLDRGHLPFLGDISGAVPTEILSYLGLALFVAVVVLCLDVLREGLWQLAAKKPNGDTLALFAVLFTLIDGITMIFTPLRASGMAFYAPCALVLTFHLLGMYVTQSANLQACRTAAAVAQPYLVTQDPNLLSGQSGFRKRLGVPKGFGSQIRTLSEPERRFRRLTPVLMAACVLLALLTTVAHHQPKLLLWSLSALFTAASTLGVGLSASLPRKFLGVRLSKLGVALAGWPGVLAGKGCRSAMLLDQDLYPPGSIVLTSSKAFGDTPMAQVASYAASTVRASASGLTFLFDRLLRSEGGAYLPVEKVVMQERGLVAQVQGQEVLVGNSDFMSRHGVALPQGVKARDAVFCAVGRSLVGVFNLKYNLHASILPALQALVTHRMSPVMITRDFNLTPHRLRLKGTMPTDQLIFPDLQRRVTLSAPNQPHGQTILAVLCREGLAPFSQALIAAKRVRTAGWFSTLFVNVSACVGVFLAATLSSAAAISSMSAWNLSLFLLLWFVPVLLISFWTKQF